MGTASAIKANPWKQSSCLLASSSRRVITPANLLLAKPSNYSGDKFRTCFLKSSSKSAANCIPLFGNKKHQPPSVKTIVAEEGARAKESPVRLTAFGVSYNNVISKIKATGLRNHVVVFAVVFLLRMIMMMLCCRHPALAYSGGIMGGFDFGSSSSSSSSSSSDFFVPGKTFYDGHMHSDAEINKDLQQEFISDTIFLTTIALFFAFMAVMPMIADRKTRTVNASVLKLQVGLSGTVRLFQKNLNCIAETADTSTSNGWKYVLKETAQHLLQYSDYSICGFSCVDIAESIEVAGELFEQIYTEEKEKFDEVTLANVNDKKIQSITSPSATDFCDECMVMTILVAAIGVHKLPTINSYGALKEALDKLHSIPTSNIQGALVLWTPQKENEKLFKRELYENYSDLKPLTHKPSL